MKRSAAQTAASRPPNCRHGSPPWQQPLGASERRGSAQARPLQSTVSRNLPNTRGETGTSRIHRTVCCGRQRPCRTTPHLPHVRISLVAAMGRLLGSNRSGHPSGGSRSSHLRLPLSLIAVLPLSATGKTQIGRVFLLAFSSTLARNPAGLSFKGGWVGARAEQTKTPAQAGVVR
jgi:hypothetical protein